MGVETGEEVEVEGARFLSANNLPALEMFGELQQRRLRGGGSNSNSVAAAGEALAAGEEAAAAAAEQELKLLSMQGWVIMKQGEKVAGLILLVLAMCHLELKRDSG